MNVLNDDYGCYYIGFFIARLNMTLHSKQFLPLFKEDTATILHEYVHYLQDISTIRGLSSIIALYQKMQLVFSQAKDPNFQFLIPIRSSQIKEMNQFAAFNDELLSLERGDNQIKMPCIQHINEIIFETENMKMLKDEYPEAYHNSFDGFQTIQIYYDNLSTPYSFGADCIAESMAYLCERVLCNSAKRVNELPYNACDLVCEYFFPDLHISPVIMIAICELALMHENSGVMFYHILKFMSDNQKSFKKVEDFEQYFSTNMHRLLEGIDTKINTVEKSLDFLYPTDIPLIENDILFSNKEIKQRIKTGFAYRKNNGLFISKAIEQQDTAFIENLFQQLGIPLLIDKNNDLFADVTLYPVLTPIAIYNSLFSENEDERCCFLYDFCKKQNQSIVNEIYCKTTPWKQANASSICPYSINIIRYGLNPNSFKFH